MTGFPPGSQRHLFAIPDGVAYFNAAYNGPLLSAAHEAIVAASASKLQPWQRVPADFFEDADRIRALSARLFGGNSDGYAIVPSASYGMAVAAKALAPTLGPGSRILVMADEFPSSTLTWRQAARSADATLDTVPAPADGDWTQAILARMGPDVRIAALVHSHWTNGATADLVAIGAAAREYGTELVLDLTQSLGALPLDLARVAPAFMVAACYKWMLGPYGTGILYVAPRWRAAEPLEAGWLTRDNATDFANLMQYSENYRAGARRFDIGETCTPLLPGAIAALEQIDRWSIDAIAQSITAINDRLAQRLAAMGFDLLPKTGPYRHLLGAGLPDRAPDDLVARLRDRNVHISQRGRALRFAPHLHVDEADIARLFDALERELGG